MISFMARILSYKISLTVIIDYIEPSIVTPLIHCYSRSPFSLARCLLFENLPQIVHLAVVQFLLTERLAQGHVGQFSFTLLNLEHSFLDTVLDQVSRCYDVSLLTHTMLRKADKYWSSAKCSRPGQRIDTATYNSVDRLGFNRRVPTQ